MGVFHWNHHFGWETEESVQPPPQDIVHTGCLDSPPDLTWGQDVFCKIELESPRTSPRGKQTCKDKL